jgi:hypothetical protein
MLQGKMTWKYSSVPRGRQTETYNIVTPFYIEGYPAAILPFQEE